MKSLEDRHIDRAQRKVDNATESTAGNVSGGVGHAVNLMRELGEAVLALTPAQREEVEVAGRGVRDEFERRMNEGETDYLGKYAGIGVVNPLIVPATEVPAPVNPADFTSQAGNGAGNLNGIAVEAAGTPEGAAAAGWGASPADDAQEGSAKPPKAPKAAPTA